MPMTPPISESVTASTRNCVRMSRPRAPDRHAQADLARPLRHRDQHDVHDADAAHEQRDGRDGGQQQGQHLRGRLLRLEHLGEVADPEVVVLVRLQAVALAQELADLVLGLPHHGRRRGPGRRSSPPTAPWPGCRRAPCSSRWRSGSGSRRPGPGPRCSGPCVSSTPTTVNGTFLMRMTWPSGSASPKRFWLTVCPSSATLAAPSTSSWVRKRPVDHPPLARLEVLRRDALERGGPVEVAVDDLRAAAHRRGGRLDERDLALDGPGVVLGDA